MPKVLCILQKFYTFAPLDDKKSSTSVVSECYGSCGYGVIGSHVRLRI